MTQLKAPQDENRRLKKMYAEARLSADLLKEAMSKNGGLGLNPWIKPKKRLLREWPEPLSVSASINDVWSMDFIHARSAQRWAQLPPDSTCWTM